MEDATNTPQDANAQPDSVAASITATLQTLFSTNEEAAIVLLQRADDDTLVGHMTDGEIGALADELLQTCQEADDED